MTSAGHLVLDSAEDLFEDAPCGYLSTRLDGTIIQVNRTFESWTGLRREDLVEERRLQDLLPPGGRIYYETVCSPLLQMQGEVREIALEVTRADGTALAALMNATVRPQAGDTPAFVRIMIFDATERRRYEEELLRGRDREQATADQLQRSLLSGAFPSSEALDIDVYYRASVRGTEVGGDWFDAFWLEEGTSVALVVGDVVGRGIAAAAVMGQLRSAVRAFASTGLGPADVLGALDGFARRHRVGTMSTVIYAQLDLGTGAVRYACAGHPPPILAAPGHGADFAWDGRSLPIDAVADAGDRSEGQLTVVAGGTLLFYSDGLIEQRRSDGNELPRLLDAARERVDGPLDGVCAAIAGALRDPVENDDVCLLAARLS